MTDQAMAIKPLDDESRLLKKIAEGDGAAFTEIYNHYSPELVAWVSRKVLTLDDAHDLVHDVFIHVWLDKGKVTAIKPYLYYITRNKIVDYFRKNASRKEYAILTKLISEPGNNPIAAIEAKDLRENLQEAIEQLPPRTREIFKLSRVENYSTAEIAEKLGLSEQTVKNQLSTALHYLRNTADRLSILALMYILYR